MKQTAADRWLQELEDRTHPLVDEKADADHPRVRIAVIDSGIDGTVEALQHFRVRIKAIRDWKHPSGCLEHRSTWGLRTTHLERYGLDVTGHGTHLTSLILNVAPWADVYIARIVDNDVPEEDIVAQVSILSSCTQRWLILQAIVHASESWNVDIICLSLGFPFFNSAIDEAIRIAVSHSSLILAAASNDGANRPSPAYPARDPQVICMNSAFFNGQRSSNNPRSKGGDNLTTLGEDVLSAWPKALPTPEEVACTRRRSGSSVATAIAVGIAANIIELIRQDGDNDHLVWAAEHLKKVVGMKLILDDMAEDVDGFRYLQPFHYLDGSQDDTEFGSFSRRAFAQRRIFNKLRTEFSYKIKNANNALVTMDESISPHQAAFGPKSCEWTHNQPDWPTIVKLERDFKSLADDPMKTGLLRNLIHSVKPTYWDRLTEPSLRVYESIYDSMLKEKDASVNCMYALQHTLWK